LHLKPLQTCSLCTGEAAAGNGDSGGFAALLIAGLEAVAAIISGRFWRFQTPFTGEATTGVGDLGGVLALELATS